MAVFNQRAELSRQKRHVPVKWDNDPMLKVLGFKETGERNLWGKMFMGVAPGINTASHAIAKSRASGDTKEALNQTFDEAVSQDLAGAAFGVSLAKTIGSGGMSGMGGGMKDLFGGGNKMMDAAGAEGFGEGAMEIAQEATQKTGPIDQKGIFGGKFKGMFGGDSKNPLANSISKITETVANDNLKNPFIEGSPEYDSFENDQMSQQNKNNVNALGGGMKDLMGSIAGGNLIETGVNFGTSLINSGASKRDAREDLQRGNFAFNPSFNYL